MASVAVAHAATIWCDHSPVMAVGGLRQHQQRGRDELATHKPKIEQVAVRSIHLPAHPPAVCKSDGAHTPTQ